MATNRYALDHGPMDALIAAPRVTLKYCELCRIQFVCSKDEAMNPGDYISLQRGAGKRVPIICPRCEANPTKLLFMREEAEEMERIAREIRRERDRFQAPSPLRVGNTREAARAQEADRKHERKRRFAKWREFLMLAFKENEYLSAQQVAAVMLAGGSIHYSTPIAAVMAARNAGVPIVRSEKVLQHKSLKRDRWYSVSLYTLSTQDEPAPLTPPRDEETHQFMKEVIQ